MLLPSNSPRAGQALDLCKLCIYTSNYNFAYQYHSRYCQLATKLFPRLIKNKTCWYMHLLLIIFWHNFSVSLHIELFSLVFPRSHGLLRLLAVMSSSDTGERVGTWNKVTSYTGHLLDYRKQNTMHHLFFIKHVNTLK